MIPVAWITSDFFLNTLGPLAILPLSIFLLVKEFVRTTNRPWRRVGMICLDIAIWPLLIVFGLVIVGRMLDLLRVPI